MENLKECMEFVLVFAGGSIACATALFGFMLYHARS